MSAPPLPCGMQPLRTARLKPAGHGARLFWCRDTRRTCLKVGSLLFRNVSGQGKAAPETRKACSAGNARSVLASGWTRRGRCRAYRDVLVACPEKQAPYLRRRRYNDRPSPPLEPGMPVSEFIAHQIDRNNPAASAQVSYRDDLLPLDDAAHVAGHPA